MIEKLLKHKYVYTVIICLLLVFSLIKTPSISVDTDISQFFNKDDADYSFYQEIKSEFASQENLILLGIKSNDSVFNPSFLNNVTIFIDVVKKIPHVKKVKSLLNTSYPIKSTFGIVAIPYIQKNKKGKIIYNKYKILTDVLSKNFIDTKGKTLFLWIDIDQNITTKNLDVLINSINELRQDSNEFKTYLWGRKVIDVSFKNVLIEEILTFGFLIFIFLCLSLIFIFKKPAVLFFPILLLLTVIIIFIGWMSSLGRPIGTLSNLFPTIVLIVAISDVIHLCIKYDLETKKGLTSKEASKNALKEIGFTTLITSFTTAIGFLVLCLSPMQAIRNFGLESALLVVLTFVLTMVFLPIFFNSIKHKDLFAISTPFNRLSNFILKKLIRSYTYQNTIIIAFSCLVLLSSFGIKFINTNSTLYTFPKNTELYNSYKFFEKNFGGSRTFELIITANNGQKLNDPALLKTVYNIESYLDKHPDLNSLKSPVDYYKVMNQAYHPINSKKNKLPLEEKTIRRYEKQFNPFLTEDYFANKDRTIFKFSAQMKDIRKNEVTKIQKDILDHIKLIIDCKPINAHISGIDLLIDISQRKSIESTFIGLLFAIFVVSITLGIVYKSIAIGTLAVFLNTIPLIITAGIMGYFNIDLRAEIALIFTVGFVIAVDDTIHLLSKFQWERKKGLSVEHSIKTAVLECGRAIIATSIILVGGFFILMRSESLEIFTLGLLIGLMVIITLLVDLILAPIIVLKYFKNKP
jgi:predicted RND superfamily exporter protein